MRTIQKGFLVVFLLLWIVGAIPCASAAGYDGRAPDLQKAVEKINEFPAEQ